MKLLINIGFLVLILLFMVLTSPLWALWYIVHPLTSLVARITVRMMQWLQDRVNKEENHATR